MSEVICDRRRAARGKGRFKEVEAEMKMLRCSLDVSMMESERLRWSEHVQWREGG